MVCTAPQQVFGGSRKRQQKRGSGCTDRIFLPSQNGALGPLGWTETAEEKRNSSSHRKRTEWSVLHRLKDELGGRTSSERKTADRPRMANPGPQHF